MNAEAADVRFKDDIHSIHLLKQGSVHAEKSVYRHKRAKKTKVFHASECAVVRVKISSTQEPGVKALPEIEKRCGQLFQLFSR